MSLDGECMVLFVMVGGEAAVTSNSKVGPLPEERPEHRPLLRRGLRRDLQPHGYVGHTGAKGNYVKTLMLRKRNTIGAHAKPCATMDEAKHHIRDTRRRQPGVTMPVSAPEGMGVEPERVSVARRLPQLRRQKV